MRMDAHVNPWCLLVMLLALIVPAPAFAQEGSTTDVPVDAKSLPRIVPMKAPTPAPSMQLPDLTNRANFSAAMQIIMLMTRFPQLGVETSVIVECPFEESLNLRRVMVQLQLFVHVGFEHLAVIVAVEPLTALARVREL